MSVATHQDYRRDAVNNSPFASLPRVGRRTVIAVAGCAVMAVSGLGLGAYLDTSTAVAAEAPPSDTAALN
jgi:hypothetical protein